MTRFHIALIAALIAVTLTGCLQSATTFIIKKDGTARIVDTMLYSPRFISMMEEMGNMGRDSADQKEFNLYDEEKIAGEAADFGEGVTFDRFEELTKGSLKGYVAYYDVSDVTMLKIQKERGTKKIKEDSGDKVNVGDEKAPDDPVTIAYSDGVLTIMNPLNIPEEDESGEPAEEMAEQEEEEASEQEVLQQLDMMSGFMRGLRFSVAIEVDGDIDETNATYVDGSRITLMMMDFSEMIKVWEENPEAFKEFDMVEDKNIAHFKELLKAYPNNAIQMEFEEEVTVKF